MQWKWMFSEPKIRSGNLLIQNFFSTWPRKLCQKIHLILQEKNALKALPLRFVLSTASMSTSLFFGFYATVFVYIEINKK